MLYFSNFPTQLFLLKPASYNKAAEYVTVTDITRNVRFKREVIDKISIYELVNITDGDTIENYTERLYGTPYYYWVLMLLNERYDYINDLPILSSAIDDKILYTYSTLPRKILKQMKDNGINTVDSFTIGTVTPDYEYLQERYGETASSLVIEIRNAAGISVDLDQVVRLIKKSDSSISEHHIFSYHIYDSVLKKRIKRYRYKSSGEQVDTKQYRIDFGAIPALYPITITEMESIVNEQKRIIKVISPEVMASVLQNFRDLI